jgi:hypothetical protein
MFKDIIAQATLVKKKSNFTSLKYILKYMSTKKQR